jgi:hypothetical protein
MQVVEGLRNLFEESSADWLLHLAISALLFDVLVQAYTANEIGDNTNSLGRFN